MLLYHYSDKNITGKLSKAFFGDNSYSQNSQETSNFKRIYFYTVKVPGETRFKYCKYLYIAEVNDKDIYDLTEDKKGVLKTIKNIAEVFPRLKKQGYKCLKFNLGYEVVNIWEDINIKEKIEL